MSRLRPNVLIAGTPGTGKTRICQQLRQSLTEWQYIDVSDFCRTNDCIESHDHQLDTDVIDEELMADKLRPIISSGGYLIDYHSVDLFPEDLIDVVFILRANNTVLFDRLKARHYSHKKIETNIECEIFNIIAEEAVEWFGPEAVHQLTNETEDQLKDNCQTILEWIRSYENK